jgi:hypothetical protein
MRGLTLRNTVKNRKPYSRSRRFMFALTLCLPLTAIAENISLLTEKNTTKIDDLLLSLESTQLAIRSEVCMPAALYNKPLKRTNFVNTIMKKRIVSSRDKVQTTIAQQYNFTPSQAQAHLVMLIFSDGNQSLGTSNINVVGNDVCLESAREITPDKTLLLSNRLPFSLEQTTHHIGDSDEYLQRITSILATRNIPIDASSVLQATQVVANFTVGQVASSYRVFDIDRYTQMYRQEHATVFIHASQQFHPYIANYLSQHGYTVVNREDKAFWRLNADIEYQDNKWLNISIALTSDKENLSLTNNPTDLPITNIATKGLLNKAIDYHLTAMQLNKHLSFIAAD